VSGNVEIELKGGMYTFMSLKLHTADLSVIDKKLADKVQQAPGFFKDTPVVLDLSVLEEEYEADSGFSASDIIERVRSHKLVPIVVSVMDKSSPIVSSIELPLIEGSAKRQSSGESSKSDGKTSGENSSDDKKQDKNKSGDESSKQATALVGGYSSEKSNKGSSKDTLESLTELASAKQVEVVIKEPMLVKRPVRSGQQLYARDTDLIVMGQVGPGAEVVADHNIHVYGPLRGRALCGVSGNTDTRIFCQSLEAELVSVAGNYQVLESIPEELRGKPAQIWLDKGKLKIEPL